MVTGTTLCRASRSTASRCERSRVGNQEGAHVLLWRGRDAREGVEGCQLPALCAPYFASTPGVYPAQLPCSLLLLGRSCMGYLKQANVAHCKATSWSTGDPCSSLDKPSQAIGVHLSHVPNYLPRRSWLRPLSPLLMAAPPPPPPRHMPAFSHSRLPITPLDRSCTTCGTWHTWWTAARSAS
jgi:hypothetical protein